MHVRCQQQQLKHSIYHHQRTFSEINLGWGICYDDSWREYDLILSQKRAIKERPRKDWVGKGKRTSVRSPRARPSWVVKEGCVCWFLVKGDKIPSIWMSAYIEDSRQEPFQSQLGQPWTPPRAVKSPKVCFLSHSYPYFTRRVN